MENRMAERDDYIFNSLSKIQYKAEELYTVSRVIHLLSDWEIEFVCQQKVRKEDGNCYLVDLFFPQLKIYLEVNEKHHYREENTKSDKLRMQYIRDTTGWKNFTIWSNSNIKSTNKQVEDFIKILKAEKQLAIDNNEFKKWITNPNELKEAIVQRGFLSREFNEGLPTQADVTSLFGAKHGRWMRGSFPWRRPFSFIKKMVWFPKLYVHAEWTNSLSTDGKTIIEQKSDGSAITLSADDHDVTRVVFGHYKNPLGNTTYLYLGEFKHSPPDSSSTKNVYHKVSDRTCLSQFSKPKPEKFKKKKATR